jgi:hypothetical protein
VSNDERIGEILAAVKVLSKEYRAITGRPLGCTGEIAEYEAVQRLGLKLAPVRQAGYDAIRETAGKRERIQIKGRCVPPGGGTQKLGVLDVESEWDAVIVVLLDEDLNPTAIHEASREYVLEALAVPGSKARANGRLSVAEFRKVSFCHLSVPNKRRRKK